MMQDWDKNPRPSNDVGNDLILFRKTLLTIAGTQMTEDAAKRALSTGVMFQGLGVTGATLPQLLLDENFVKAAYMNLSNAFVNLMTPFFGKNPFRVKFVRTSKKKHFAKLPKALKGEVWIESMKIPAAQSQVKWSEYELKNGLNDGTPTETDKPAQEDVDNVDQQFAAPGATAPAVDPSLGVPVAPPAQPQIEAQPQAFQHAAQQPVAQPQAVVQPQAQPAQQAFQQPAAQPVTQPAYAAPFAEAAPENPFLQQ